MDSNCFINHTSFLPSIHPACLCSSLPALLPACLPSLCHSCSTAILSSISLSLHAYLSSLLPSLFASLLAVKGRRHYTRSIAKPRGQKMLAAKDQSSMDYLPGLEVLGGIVLRVIESRKPVKALFPG